MNSLLSAAAKLSRDYPVISEQMTKQRLEVILRQLANVLNKNIPGDVAEFGCYVGTTSLFLRRLLDATGSDKQFHVYDSFSGLPAKTIKDASVAGSDFKAGELKAAKRELVRNFRHASLKPPVIHKGWFSELEEKEIPDVLAFVFIDGDFYSSIMESLERVWGRLSKDGVVLIDDYKRSNLPGVTRAVEDFFQNIDVSIRHEKDLAIIRKKTS